jgi:hypothetical protein
MPSVNITFSHATDFEDAKAGAKEVMEGFHKKYGALMREFTISPDNTSATFSGSAFKGSFKLDETTVHVDIDLSLIAAAFKGRVESEMLYALGKRFPKGKKE